MTKKELAAMYYSKTNKELASELGVSTQTLLSTLKKLDIPQKGKGKGQNKAKIQIED